MADPTDRPTALEVLVGEWTVQVPFPGSSIGRVSFEWTLDRRYLLQRSEVPDSPVPSSLALFAPNGDGFRQHYFDSRGVVRLYSMTLRDSVWTMLRTEPDFSPLDFHQRFVGTFSADGHTVDGRWESSPDGASWELDFPLTYTRVRAG